jgi:hypothetical protein
MQSLQKRGSQFLKKVTETFMASDSDSNLGVKELTERISAKSLSDQFFSQHNRTLAMQSF